MSVRFAIVCLGRSGSTHLQSLLDSHPDVRCFGELFSDRPASNAEGFVQSAESDPEAYLSDLLAGAPESAVGFKLPMNSIRAHPAAAEIVRASDEIRVIRLSRRNLLAQLVSRRLQAETRVAHSINGSYGDATVEIDPARALNALARMEADEAELDGIVEGRPSFRLAYEQLIVDEGLEDLQRFLEVEPRPLRSWFEKLRTRPLAETVSNWGELEARLRGTRYEPLLAEAP